MNLALRAQCAAAAAMLVFCAAGEAQPAPEQTARTASTTGLFFENVAESAGVAGINASHVAFADLNNDFRPDLILTEGTRRRVFLNVSEDVPGVRGEFNPADAAGNAAVVGAAGKRAGVRFVEVASPNLPAAATGDCCVFADLDNNGTRDAIIARYIDVNAKPETDQAKADAFPPPARTAWLSGNADGTFGDQTQPDRGVRLIDAAKPATTRSVALGDVNDDGLLDLFLGNWYTNYGKSLEGFTNDLLVQLSRADLSEPVAFRRSPLPEDNEVFDEERDAAGRPTYGVMILPCMVTSARADLVMDVECGAARSLWSGIPALLELNYGRRANRLLVPDLFKTLEIDQMIDIAPKVGVDGDAIRHGRYPAWLAERAKSDARFKRDDEKPFRSHGNTFDAAVNDVNNDELMDLFVAEITHAWAGESSDRSRFLVQLDRPMKTGDHPSIDPGIRFVTPADHNVDRAPLDPDARSWNQGDVYCELADFDNDGRVDLLLASGQYPDEQRLRLFRQRKEAIDAGDGRGPRLFEDVTIKAGIDHIGSGQISLADVDADGDLDIAAGQSFSRMTPEQIAGRAPSIALWINRLVERSTPESPARSLTLFLRGDPAQKISTDPLGATVVVDAIIDGTSVRQFRPLFGIGGHAGKQHEFIVHVGLGDATDASVHVSWPGHWNMTSHHGVLKPGRRQIRLEDSPETYRRSLEPMIRD